MTLALRSLSNIRHSSKKDFDSFPSRTSHQDCFSFPLHIETDSTNKKEFNTFHQRVLTEINLNDSLHEIEHNGHRSFTFNFRNGTTTINKVSLFLE